MFILRCRDRADTPPLSKQSSQAAANQMVSGVRVLSKMVPAVRDTRASHDGQRQVRPATGLGGLITPQCVQTREPLPRS